MVAGTPPDVVAIFGAVMRTVMEQKMVLPLDTYIKAGKFDTKDFLAGVLKGMSWNGEQYAIPQYLNTNVVMYNRELFKRADVPAPTEAWTLDQVVEYARRLTRGSLPVREVWGVALLSWTATSRFLPLIWARCGDINDPNDPGVFTFSKRENVPAFQWLHDLRWKHRLAAGGNADLGGVAPRDAMYSVGNLAMSFDSTAAIGVWKDRAQTDWAIAPLPKGLCGRGEWSAMDGYVIPAGTKTPDASWLVLEGITGKDINRLRAEIAWECPARKSQFGAWASLLPERQMKFAVPTDAARPEVSTLWPKAADVGRAITPIFEKLFDENAVSVPDALKQLNEAVIGVLGPSAVKQ
jgi:ABC-type glycerol-3-phosphate transport system substrate-binding protein